MEIKPFKAVRYNPDVVENVGDCISPPYDVIDEALQNVLYEKNPHNIVRIIKGKTCETDTGENNQYTRAADFLKSWFAEDVLKEDLSEAIYAYVQNFTTSQNEFQRSGFVALAKLEDWGKKVSPHENTLDKPKIDRLNLTRATAAQFGQIFMLYDDAEKIADNIIDKVASTETLIDFVDESDVRHRLFAITDENDMNAIQEMMADKPTIIADGHHRYETALNYYKETQNPAAAYQMVTLVNVRNEGLIILPTHRLVGNLENFAIDKLVTALKENFEVEKVDTQQKMFEHMKADFGQNKNTFGIYAGSNAFYIAALADNDAMAKAALNKSSAWQSLDASALHKLILENALGIGDEQLACQSNVEYIKDKGDAVVESIAKVDAGQKQVVFFMNPTKMEQIQAVADKGERMPQKSTFFFPKIYTGLTINKL